jgi:ligand-binding sensor protein
MGGNAMPLTDLLPVEKWIELEKSINEKYGLNAAVFDKDGVRVTDYVNWGNPLCPVIKKNKRGQTYICALAHKNISTQIQKTGMPGKVECDAGFIKFAVPIYWEGNFLGVAGGCGRTMTGTSIESFLINKITEIDEEKINELLQGACTMESVEVDKAIDFITQELEKLVSEYAYAGRHVSAA